MFNSWKALYVLWINIHLYVKFIRSLLHSPNIIVKSVKQSSIRSRYSTFGENFRYISYRYDVSPTSWISPLCKVYKCLNDYVTDFIITSDISIDMYISVH